MAKPNAARLANYDAQAMGKSIIERQEESGRQIVRLSKLKSPKLKAKFRSGTREKARSR